MKWKYFFSILLIFCIILSVNFVVAQETNNLSESIISNQFDDVSEIEYSMGEFKVSEVNTGEILEEGNSSQSSQFVYVDENNGNVGNGSYENPYSSLELVKDNAGELDSLTVNIFNGTYYLGSELKFNVNNLIINGMNDSVIIKNLYDDRTHKEAFEVSSNSANVTMNNIIFDGSDRISSPIAKNYFFTPFYGVANTVIYNNCTFIGSKQFGLIGANEFNVKFINCIFKNFDKNQQVFKINNADGNKYMYFENCVLSLQGVGKLTRTISTNKNITLNNVWFGQNSLPDYIRPGTGYARNETSRTWDANYLIPVSRFAIFNATENYLGNNIFEIVGQLTWNGTNDNVGNSFNPMTVLLSSETGDIISEAILENGTFKAIYTSNSTDNKVTAKLDDEVITLDFKSVDVIIDAPAINVGDNQNINLTFTQPINNTITVTVNNKTYEVKVDSDSINFTVPEALKEGKYIIDVVTSDEINHIYGSNSTELVVSKVSDYTFTPIVPSDAKVDDTVTINVELPSDATGTVIVSVGDNNFSADASANVEINITGLVAGDNNIVVTYSGDDKYVNKSSEGILTAEKVELDITNETLNVETPEGTVNPEFSIALPNDATGNLTVIVNNKTYTQGLVNGSAKITVDDLTPGDYNATVTYTGDDKYDAITTTTNLTVPKVDVPINNNTLVTDTPKGTTTPEFSIVLPNDATGNLTVTINGKDYTQELVNGSAKVTIPNLTPGDYNATITYSGDDKYDPIVSNTTVSVPKPVLTAKNISMLYTSGTKYTVQVKVDGKAVTGKTVNFVINGKKTTAKTDKNGYASVKITLPPKSKAYKVTANYLGVKVTNKVTVKSIVVAKNLKAKKSAKTLKIKVTLKKVNKKYLKGKKVTLKFKGKTYKVKTNKKGVATFTIKKNVLNKLKVGKKYTYKVTYGKDSVNKKITIKK